MFLLWLHSQPCPALPSHDSQHNIPRLWSCLCLGGERSQQLSSLYTGRLGARAPLAVHWLAPLHTNVVLHTPHHQTLTRERKINKINQFISILLSDDLQQVSEGKTSEASSVQTTSDHAISFRPRARQTDHKTILVFNDIYESSHTY